jgi:4-amino-4-deoxy-L-arabinose transferase-like glycosyltransferase
MNKFKIIIQTIVFIGVLILSYKLRLFNYDKIPLPGQSMDEYSYSWVGLSLIELGVPVGISGIDGYKNSDMRYINVDRVFQETAKGNPLSVERPWFDHPPLMGVVTGGFAYIKGARVFEDTISAFIRKPMVYLGTISVALVGCFVIINFGFVTGIVAMLIYGTMPIVVIGSRMIQAENGLIPMTLLTMIFLSSYIKYKKLRWLWLAGIAAGIGTLFKLSGVTNILMVGIVLLVNKNNNKWQEIAIFGTVALSITSLFFVYGMVYDWETFVSIFNSNSNRFYGIGPVAIYDLMTQVKLTHNKYLTDFWPLVGWVGYWVLMAKKQKNVGEIILMVATMSYLVTYIFMGSQSYGWYVLPFWPLLAMSLAVTFVELWKNGQMLVVWLWLLVPIGGTIGKLMDINKFQEYAGIWRYGLALITVVMLISQLKKDQKYLTMFSKVVVIVTFLIAIYLNTKYLGMFDINYWYKM